MIDLQPRGQSTSQPFHLFRSCFFSFLPSDGRAPVAWLRSSSEASLPPHPRKKKSLKKFLLWVVPLSLLSPVVTLFYSHTLLGSAFTPRLLQIRSTSFHNLQPLPPLLSKRFFLLTPPFRLPPSPPSTFDNTDLFSTCPDLSPSSLSSLSLRLLSSQTKLSKLINPQHLFNSTSQGLSLRRSTN